MKKTEVQPVTPDGTTSQETRATDVRPPTEERVGRLGLRTSESGDSAYSPPSSALGPPPSTPLTPLAICSAVAVIAFAKPLFDLLRLAFRNELYSHVLLIPFVSAYFIWLRRDQLKGIAPKRSPLFVAPLVVAGALLGWSWLAGGSAPIDLLSARILSFVFVLIACALFSWGAGFLRAIAFPAAFLLFIVPFPTRLEHWIEVFFQYTSAEAASALFGFTTTPVFRDGLLFKLPGISIRVAEECSGIRSSLVLFITSLVAGQMFLRSPWRRAFLTFFVIPLGIVRNGFRIFTIGMLCVHVGPHMIDSPIHHRGGPIFFALSLIPFFLVLFFLRKKSEIPEGRCSTSP